MLAEGVEKRLRGPSLLGRNLCQNYVERENGGASMSLVERYREKKEERASSDSDSNTEGGERVHFPPLQDRRDH